MERAPQSERLASCPWGAAGNTLEISAPFGPQRKGNRQQCLRVTPDSSRMLQVESSDRRMVDFISNKPACDHLVKSRAGTPRAGSGISDQLGFQSQGFQISQRVSR